MPSICFIGVYLRRRNGAPTDVRDAKPPTTAAPSCTHAAIGALHTTQYVCAIADTGTRCGALRRPSNRDDNDQHPQNNNCIPRTHRQPMGTTTRVASRRVLTHSENEKRMPSRSSDCVKSQPPPSMTTTTCGRGCRTQDHCHVIRRVRPIPLRAPRHRQRRPWKRAPTRPWRRAAARRRSRASRAACPAPRRGAPQPRRCACTRASPRSPRVGGRGSRAAAARRRGPEPRH